MEFYFRFIEKVINDCKQSGKDPRNEVVEINDLTLQEIKNIETFTKGRVQLKLTTIYF